MAARNDLQAMIDKRRALKVLSDELQEKKVDWDKKSDTRLKNENDLVDTTKYRYSLLKGKTAYTSANPIDECFEPLVQDLRMIESKITALKCNCRVRGYIALGTLGAAIGGATTGVMSMVSNPVGLNWGLGVYIGVLTLLTGGVGYHLNGFIDYEFGKLVKDREALILKAFMRVAPLAIKLSPIYNKLEALSDEKVKEYHTLLSNMQNMLIGEFEQEDRILRILKKIIKPLNADHLKQTVFVEMLMGWMIIIGLAVIGRFTRPIPK